MLFNFAQISQQPWQLAFTFNSLMDTAYCIDHHIKLPQQLQFNEVREKLELKYVRFKNVTLKNSTSQRDIDSMSRFTLFERCLLAKIVD